GGEALPSESASRLRAALPSVRLVNLYGPTEVTIDATFAEVSGKESGLTLPIGRPVANTHAYVLDSALHPLPIGVPGELFLGGAQLALGYLGRPQLTAERFVPNPFSAQPGARLYRTGDKARWLADGTLQYLGRVDFQVKLRGQRIELGEIEAALLQQPGVRDAVALVRHDVAGHQHLVAYLVPSEAALALEAETLRTALLRLLPEYMVPSAFVSLQALPLTPNGKLDRKALPAPDSQHDHAFLPPSSPTEVQLASLWLQLLRVERVGLNDSFFALGGHSLLATQLVSRIRSSFGAELPLRAVFEAPSLAALARRIDSAHPHSALQAPPVRAVPRTGVLPLSFAQQRLWLIDQLQPNSPAYNIPTALRVEGALDVAALESSLRALIQRHESLRTTFSLHDEEPIQVIHPDADFSLPVVDLSALPTEQRETQARRLATEEALRPFSLVTSPLIRGSLLRLQPTSHVLLVTMHHIVSDAWSSGVLVRELAELYAARTSGTQSHLPPLPVQYADFAAWQRGWLRGDVLQRQLDYWRHQLSGAPALLELPTDKPRPSVQSHRSASVPVSFSHPLSEELLAFCQRQGTTPFMTLLAAFQLLLSRYSGQDDVVVGAP
ncbi:condensation domain-containing protein, partial [Myxococcus eversor]|uniref:condensation domain-containing protein n=1 Tax=Myxococcus eversor TaxID=2709661 RepID=UPI0013D0DF01